MRILLVEDEKRMAQALCEILRLERYEVDHYANGLDGLAAIESNIYDIVILDVMLPEVYISFTRKKLAFVEAKTEIKAVRGVGYELRCDDV